MSDVAQAVISEAETDLVRVEDRGTWAIVTINRPDKRNAMNAVAQQRLRDALTEVWDKRVVVLTGVGTAFCAGVDLKEAAEEAASSARVGSQEVNSWSRCNDAIRLHPAVFIAAVNGYALGGGSTLVHNCELAIAAESAVIGTPELGFGSWPGQAGPALINRALPKHAAEIIFMAKRIDAATAYRMGLVNEVVPDESLLSRVAEVAEHIAGFDATALDWSKKAFRAMVNMSWEDSMELSRHITRGVVASRPAAQEGFTIKDFVSGRRGSGQGT